MHRYTRQAATRPAGGRWIYIEYLAYTSYRVRIPGRGLWADFDDLLKGNLWTDFLLAEEIDLVLRK